MTKQQYYLTSKWKSLAKKCKELANNKCTLCGSTENLHAHHLTYKNLGNEKQEDLQCLCKNCHEETHGFKFKEYISKKKQGWTAMYRINYDEVFMEMKSQLDKKVFLDIRDSFSSRKIECSFNQSEIANKLKSTRGTVNKIFRRLEKIEAIIKIENGSYRMNPYMYIPPRCNGLELQEEWNELTDNETMEEIISEIKTKKIKRKT